MFDPATALEPSPTSLIADLNHLLRLDHDAAEACAAALGALADGRHRLVLLGHRRDHQRHVVELARLIRRYGGEPLDPGTQPIGAFRWGIHAVVALGGDREILSAFRANEERVRDEYRRRARAPLPTEVVELLRRNAADEERHLAAVEEILAAQPQPASTLC